MAHFGWRIGDFFAQMAPYRCFEERADSDLVPEMDELPAGFHLFGIDRFGYLFPDFYSLINQKVLETLIL